MRSLRFSFHQGCANYSIHVKAVEYEAQRVMFFKKEIQMKMSIDHSHTAGNTNCLSPSEFKVVDPTNLPSHRSAVSIASKTVLILGTAFIVGACASHGHIDNTPCTYPYTYLDDSARLAIYLDEHGTVVARELVATDSVPSPPEPPHYWVHGRCYVSLVDPGAACTSPTPYVCKAGNQSWCSKIKC
jgi:hypothetical protein